MADKNKTDPRNKIKVFDLIFAFAFPMVIGKVAIVYFGSNYSTYPNEGYGVGLIISILFTLGMVARLLWKYRNYKDS
jgi:hypothetical protein